MTEAVSMEVAAVDVAAPNVAPGSIHDVTPANGWELPVRVVLAYRPGDLPRGVDESDLVVLRQDGDSWSPVPGSQVDISRHQVRADTTELGRLGVGWTGCDVRYPSTCTLATAGAATGVRMGATLDPAEIGDPGHAGTLISQFSAVTPENAMKMYSIENQRGEWTFDGADRVVAFARSHGLAIRGHTLVWAQDQYTPAWVRAITDPAELEAVTKEYIERVVGRYAGQVARWDVVNEPLGSFGTTRSGSVWDDLLGPAWIGEAFRLAHSVDPGAELWLNEYGTDWVPGKHAALLALVAELVSSGVPIHGVGLQMHRLSPEGPAAGVLEAQLQDFTALGVDVAITELDVPTNPTDATGPAAQADAYDRITRACLAVPRCVEITTWGITDASTWLDSIGVFPTPTRPLLFDAAYAPKPAYHAVRAALAEGRPT